MSIPPALAERIEDVAKREGLTTEELLQTLLDEYEHRQQQALDAFIGAFDDDVSDMSVTVNETLQQKFKATDDRST